MGSTEQSDCRDGCRRDCFFRLTDEDDDDEGERKSGGGEREPWMRMMRGVEFSDFRMLGRVVNAWI